MADPRPAQTHERGEVLWEPPADTLQRTRMGHYLTWLQDARPQGHPPIPAQPDLAQLYKALWQWSVDMPGVFWQSLWDYFAIQAATPPSTALADATMPGAQWFPGATLNYADHALRGPADQPAIVAHSHTRPPQTTTFADLADQVARCRAGLRHLGVGRGDRVAAYLPNIPEAVVAMLATASLGAIWTSCPPEFGTRSVVDRFSQVEPVVLLAVDGYRYGGRAVDRVDEVSAIRDGLPSLRACVAVSYLASDRQLPGTTSWDALLADSGPDAGNGPGEPVPFDHPLYVLYSSGTTGLPKPIVHGHGGILLEHLKTLALHADMKAGDRFFWFTTTGWMMWNYLLSGLLVDATIVLFDGDPGYPDLGSLWELAGEEQLTHFGVSAPFLLACRKEGLRPAARADLAELRSVGSTGAPLPAEGFRWVYDELGIDVHLSSISGGTDVCTAFVGGNPFSPVRAGEISARYLGVKAEAQGPDGTLRVGEEGELVISQPMPSMPVGFWGDTDGSRYRAAYFEDRPGAWAHGDWITVWEDGACLISGRSDATLNRGGVRMGTAELYAVVESMDEVADSLVIHLEDDAGGPGRLLLYVAPALGVQLDDELKGRIAGALRAALSPRHVPDEVHEVREVPRTLSGKKLEVPVKRILAGVDPDVAASRESLANPTSLDAFRPVG